ncbi:hypothetical protein BIU82_15455 [Arthrobacter sp. SW1]|uniref:hypothetical protein n=1 Tax=Arthrobacter sp. SW1 TaxID=1920889 RepID=UPI000877D1F7|nr:hypothetical protein [Arthrobacter sp. SW1]OFI39250.1 hypothetical protein BIU82_15455 [Arthrobacter sp. SW1]
MHPTLRRLDRLAASLAERPGTVAVLGLGSAGAEFERFDEHSDIDFFVITGSASEKAALLEDPSWLEGLGGTVSYSFVNDANGRKALFDDGLFTEYAVFTSEEFHTLPVVGVRVAWSREPDALNFGDLPVPAPAVLDTEEFHLNEALTNLYVGLHRELRGEHLAAFRFIQVHAMDRVLALLRLDPAVHWQRDVFDASRRAESVPGVPFAEMVPGYGKCRAAASATLGWLESRYPVDPVIGEAIRALLERGPAVANGFLEG